jgi:hypothetical protein
MVIASVYSLTTIPILVNLYWLCSAPVQHTIRVVVGIVTSVVGIVTSVVGIVTSVVGIVTSVIGIVTSVVGIVASFMGLVSSGCVGILVTAAIGIAIRYN